jgi:hypothetical protein
VNFEEWRPIIGYEGLYEISNFGRVKSLAKVWYTGNYNSRREKPETIMTPRFNGNGYHQALLRKNGSRVNISNHLLVWDHFGNSPRNGRELCVDHIDNNKTNNHINNLQLLTHRQNVSKAMKLIKGKGKYTGVCWNKNAKKWVVNISIKNKNHYLGLFSDEEKAKSTYNKKLRESSEQ